MTKAGYKPKSQRPASRRNRHYNWKGGRFVGQKGYVYILMPEHPRARMGGYVCEHILVAEKKLGRPLRPDEITHHLNEDKTDNRPENIEVMTRAEHVRLHKPRLNTGAPENADANFRRRSTKGRKHEVSA